MDKVSSKDNKGEHLPKIAVIAFPWQAYAPYKFLSDVLEILTPISESVLLINGNTNRIKNPAQNVVIYDLNLSVHYSSEIKPKIFSNFFWIIKLFMIQIKTSLKVLYLHKEIDLIIFYMAYPYFQLPLLISKLCHLKTIEVITRSQSNSPLIKLLKINDYFLYHLIDGISPESPKLIKDLHLDRFELPILIEGSRYIETNKYSITKQMEFRENVIGYIGRFTQEKGIKEFIGALEIIGPNLNDIRIFIGGDGPLRNWIIDSCKELEERYNLSITIMGWIGEDLPDFLNDLKLLVIPSYSDALPTIMLESMACGTPVLATRVGGIPDVIIPEKTGFLIEKNTPEIIAEMIIECLNSSNLNQMSIDCRTLIENKFSFENAVSRWQKIITFSKKGQKITY